MNDSKVTVIGVLFLLLCLGLVGGIWYLDGQLRELRQEYNTLDQSRADLQRDVANLREQVGVFNDAFRTLGEYNVSAAQNEMHFLTQVQQIIDPYIWSEHIVMVSSQQGGVNAAGRATQSFTLRGDYYAFKRILAAWRNVEVTVRVSALSMMASRTPQMHGEIQADVTLEAIVN